VFKKIIPHTISILILSCSILACSADKMKTKSAAETKQVVNNKNTLEKKPAAAKKHTEKKVSTVPTEKVQEKIGSALFDYTGMNGRRILATNKKVWPEVTDRILAGENKTIGIMTCVNQYGKVIHAEIDKIVSNVNDNGILQQALRLVGYSMFETDRENTEDHCGLLKITIDKTNVQ